MKWPEVSIQEVCLAAVDCVNRTAPTVDYETPYKMIRTSNIKNGFINIKDVKYVTEETYEKWTRRLVPEKGDVVLTREAPLGQVGRITTDEKIFLGQRIMHYRPNPNIVDSNYLAYVLQSPIVQSRIKSTGFGVTVEHARVGDCLSLKVPLPPLEVQTKIGRILASYDDLIENNRRRIELLEQAARLLYQEWFVYFRFPSHEHVKIVDGVPEGWRNKPLGEVAPLQYGRALKAENRVPGPHPVYGSSGIVGYHVSPLIQGPAIIVGRKGNVGSVFWSSSDCYPIDTVYFIDKTRSSLFLYYSLANLNFISTDVAVPGLNRDFAHSRTILIPDDKTVDEFHRIVVPIYQQISVLEKYNDRIAQAREIVLPRLMNGEIAI